MVREKRTPWSVSISSLSQRAGQTLDIDETMPAPDGIGDAVIGIPKGSPVYLSGTAESLTDGLLFTGTVGSLLLLLSSHEKCSRRNSRMARRKSRPTRAAGISRTFTPLTRSQQCSAARRLSGIISLKRSRHNCYAHRTVRGYAPNAGSILMKTLSTAMRSPT